MKRKQMRKIRWKEKRHGKSMVPRYVRNRETWRRRKYVGTLLSTNSDNEKTVQDSQGITDTLTEFAILGGEMGIQSVARIGIKRRGELIKGRKCIGTFGMNRTQVSEEKKYATRSRSVVNDQIKYGGDGVKHGMIHSFLQKVKCRKVMKKSNWKIIVVVLGGCVAVCVMIMAILGMLATSPFSIIFCNEIDHGEGITLDQAIETVEKDFIEAVEEQIGSQTADQIVICSGEGVLKIENWNEILAVYAINTRTKQIQSNLDSEQMDLLRQIVEDMIFVEIEVQNITCPTESGGDELMRERVIAVVRLVSNDIEDIGVKYGFTDQEKTMLKRIIQALKQARE